MMGTLVVKGLKQFLEVLAPESKGNAKRNKFERFIFIKVIGCLAEFNSERVPLQPEICK